MSKYLKLNLLHVLFITMLHSFHLQNTQKVKIDKTTSVITFQTRTVSGCVYYFPLTLHQFLAFDDAIAVIKSVKYKISGSYPLGQNLWFYYDSHTSTLYNNNNHCPYFRFQHFHLYLTRLHHKILSFLRKEANGRVNRKRVFANNNDNECEIQNNKRSLPSVVQPTPGFETITNIGGKWKTVPCSPNDVIDSDTEQTDTILSKRKCANSRRRDDSSSATSHTCEDFSTSEEVYIDIASDFDQCMDCE